MNPTDKYEQIKDIKRLNPVELEAMVLHHEQQIKDLAAHLLELKQLVTPMMEFKRREWIGLTDEETRGCVEATIEITDPLLLDAVNAVIIDVERLLREKNT